MSATGWMRTVGLACLGMCVWLPWLAQAQTPRDPAWLRDMPSVADVTRQIRGASTAQTLGRQCAALTRLWRGTDLPAAYLYSPTPAMKALSESYRQGLNTLQQSYNANVKPLSVPANRQEWDRMCGNYQSGVHPVTGQPDAGFPALDQRVTETEWVALLKPAARAAYDAERQARDQRAAASRAQQEAQARATEARKARERQELALYAGLVVGGVVLGVALLLWMLWLLRNTTWQPEPGNRQVRLRGRLWDVKDLVGLVLAAQKDRETVITSRSSGGGPNNAPVSVSVSSHSRIHWDIRLTLPDGREHDLRLSDWDIAVQPGDILQLFWFTRGNRESPYLLVFNRRTQQHWGQSTFVYAQLMPLGVPAAILLIIAIVALGIPTFGLSWLFGAWWGWRLSKKARQAAEEVIAWLHALPPPVITMAPDATAGVTPGA